MTPVLSTDSYWKLLTRKCLRKHPYRTSTLFLKLGADSFRRMLKPRMKPGGFVIFPQCPGLRSFAASMILESLQSESQLSHDRDDAVANC